MAPCLCEKRECVCVCLGLRFIRVAVEHSMMLNLAYRGFSKNRCMQVVDATSVFNGPFLSQRTIGFLKASALHCTASNPSFYFFCDFYVDFLSIFPKAGTLQNLQIGICNVCTSISHPKLTESTLPSERPLGWNRVSHRLN